MQEQLILVVDDTPANLEVISELLTQVGYDVSTAIDGERALKQVQYNSPDLILLDVMMPGIDGFETCRRLKDNPATHDIPIIFMTAVSDIDNKVKAFSLGAVDYITKPFQEDEVLARVKTHIRLYSLTKDLENQIQERTKQLSQALQNLQQSQMTLVQNEKMFALAQVVAGVAHEINNPINFIHGNLSHAQKYLEDMLKLLQLYETHVSYPIIEIQIFSKLIDLNFIQSDLPKLLSSMLVGTKRVQEIVRSLRIFSRLDEAEIKEIDIHSGIDSTLMILNSRLLATNKRPAIKVVREYGELPPVECYARQINQVFLNILTNAIDALEYDYKLWFTDSGLESANSLFEVCSSSINKPVPTPQFSIPHSQLPTIWIRTQLNPDKTSVLIQIQDNGIGMSQEIKQKIFDQFFTTKPVGKGIGLGLSIAYQIVVEKHRGHLEANSVLELGTEFKINIPIKTHIKF
ncbi:MAG: response regulator [Rhizonema sp. PD37]|nr:response regulator [Rhizonema sp. PD37]